MLHFACKSHADNILAGGKLGIGNNRGDAHVGEMPHLGCAESDGGNKGSGGYDGEGDTPECLGGEGAFGFCTARSLPQATLIGLAVQLLSGHPLWAVLLMLVGIAILLYEALNSRWVVDNVPSMFQFLAVVFILVILGGAYFKTISKFFWHLPKSSESAPTNNVSITTAAPPTTKPSPNNPQKPKHLPQNPLTLIGFNWDGQIVLFNTSDYPLYVIALRVEESISRSNMELYFEVPPHKTVGHSVAPASIPDMVAIPTLGSTWIDHYNKAVALYKTDCLVFGYYAPDDSGIAMVRQRYASQGGLGTGDAFGTLWYQVAGTAEKKSEQIRLLVTLFHKIGGDCHA